MASVPDRLITTALEQFASRGYEGVSVREIERVAGVNRGLAAYHFGTKLELWRAAVASLMQELLDELERAREYIDIVSPEEGARIVIKVYVGFVSRRPEFFRILIFEGRNRTERARWLSQEYVKPVYSYFELVSERTDHTPEEAAIEYFTLMGATSLIFALPGQSQDLFGVDPADPAFAERFADVAADLARTTAPRALP